MHLEEHQGGNDGDEDSGEEDRHFVDGKKGKVVRQVQAALGREVRACRQRVHREDAPMHGQEDRTEHSQEEEQIVRPPEPDRIDVSEILAAGLRRLAADLQSVQQEEDGQKRRDHEEPLRKQRQGPAERNSAEVAQEER